MVHGRDMLRGWGRSWQLCPQSGEALAILPAGQGAAPAAGNAAARPVQRQRRDGWMEPQPQR